MFFKPSHAGDVRQSVVNKKKKKTSRNAQRQTDNWTGKGTLFLTYGQTDGRTERYLDRQM